MSKQRYYIGLAASHHDPAIAIVDPAGEVVFAEAAERYLQDKRAFNSPPNHFARAPELIQKYCEPGAQIVVATSRSRRWAIENRLMVGAANALTQAPFVQTLWDDQTMEYLWPGPRYKNGLAALMHSVGQADNNIAGIKNLKHDVVIKHYDHHLTHAAATCYTSAFAEGVCAVVDGSGEWRSCDFFHYSDGQIRPIKSPSRTNRDTGSLGFFYAFVCDLCGFDPMKGEEWKVMGLASYGQYNEQLYQLLRPTLRAADLNLHFPRLNFRSYIKALQAVRRKPGTSPLEAADLAYTGQYVFAEVMEDLLRNVYRHQASDQLMYNGGCALNSSWNGQITQRTNFKHVYIPAAPGDDGNAIGAALLAYYEDNPTQKPAPRMPSPFLGSSMSKETLKNLQTFGRIEKLSALDGELYQRAAALLAEGKILGWIQGRAEFGPRALGNRSILADPRSADMVEKINARVKFRERFRPFAPSIPDQFGDAYFEHYQESPYMDRTLRFRPEVRDTVPAVVHVDNTGRLQTVKPEWSEKYYRLIGEFQRLTGVPLLLNTSFNIMGKPIAHSVEDAIGLFYTTGLDALVVEDYLIEK
jgi:carbamoyltransferase